MEWKCNSHSSCIYEPGIIGDKDSKILVAPQVMVCALTRHTETTKKYGNTAVNLPWDDHPLFSSPNWCCPEIVQV